MFMEEHTPNQILEKHNSIYPTVWIDQGKQLVFKGIQERQWPFVLIPDLCVVFRRFCKTASYPEWHVMVHIDIFSCFGVFIPSHFSISPVCDSLLFLCNLLITITSKYDIMGLISLTDWWTDRHGHKQGPSLRCNCQWLIKTLISATYAIRAELRARAAQIYWAWLSALEHWKAVAN